MNKRPLGLMKTCSICGQQKLLSAFLEISGVHGTTYGNVCASCRKTVMEKKANTEAEDSSKSKTGAVIDAKTKLQIEIDIRKKRQLTKERHIEENKKKDEATLSKIEKTEQTSQVEKKYRDEKRSFFSSSSTAKTPARQPIFGSEEQIAKAGEIDLSITQTDFAVGKAKYQSARWHEFLNRIGLNAPQAAAQKLTSQATNSVKAKQESLIKNLKSWANAQEKKSPTENPPEDFVNKNWRKS